MRRRWRRRGKKTLLFIISLNRSVLIALFLYFFFLLFAPIPFLDISIQITKHFTNESDLWFHLFVCIDKHYWQICLHFIFYCYYYYHHHSIFFFSFRFCVFCNQIYNKRCIWYNVHQRLRFSYLMVFILLIFPFFFSSSLLWNDPNHKMSTKRNSHGKY